MKLYEAAAEIMRTTPKFCPLNVREGVVLVAGDCHYWPDRITTAHRALVNFAADLDPTAVIMNGDVVDGASISRFPDTHYDGKESKPLFRDELSAAQARLREIEKASPHAAHFWPFGNHDMRFEMKLVNGTPELAGVPGTRLKDHFPAWTPCWGVWINKAQRENSVVVKHRLKGGAHAIYGNVKAAGTNIVTGHLHALNVRRVSNYNGHQWGVDGGTLAVPYDDQFMDYTEGNPVDWASGFVVLTFEKGRVLWPELCHVVDEENGVVSFRGKLIEV